MKLQSFVLLLASSGFRLSHAQSSLVQLDPDIDGSKFISKWENDVRYKVLDSIDRRVITIKISALEKTKNTLLVVGATTEGVALGWIAAALVYRRVKGVHIPRLSSSIAVAAVAGALAFAAILVGFFLWGYDSVFKSSGQTLTAQGKRDRDYIINLSPVRSLSALTSEACNEMNDLGVVADETAEEELGKDFYEAKFKQFEPLFVLAQDNAHNVVVSEIMNLPIEVWPVLAHPPSKPINGTLAQDMEYNSAVKKWVGDTVYVIPKLKHAVEIKYMDYYYNQTMERVWLHNSEAGFHNEPLTFRKLSFVFLHKSSLPCGCENKIKESSATTEKMKSIRERNSGRDSRFYLALEENFRLRTELTRNSIE